MPVDILVRLGIALGLGLLIGLQRESTQSREIAGIRTFALIALSGAVAGLLAPLYGAWLLAAGVLALAILLGVANILLARDSAGRHDAGLTTEVAAVLVFLISAYLMQGEMEVAVVTGGITAVLLHVKSVLHGWVSHLGKEDLKAMMQFVLITLVILPVLPDDDYGPFAVLNPREIWLMVVLIVGIGLFAYLAYHLFSAKAGTLLGGLLGGLISSTATTVSSSRAAKGQPERATPAALVILIATAVSVVRILVEMFAVARGHFMAMVWPFIVLLAVFGALSAMLYFSRSDEVVEVDPPENPAELKPALVFGALYALVLLAVAAGRHYFGDSGMYVVAVISGLTDVDAITLSTAQLVSAGNLDPSSAWRVVMVGAVSNTVFKGGIVAVLGGAALFKRIAVLYGIAVLAGLALVVFWP